MFENMVVEYTGCVLDAQHICAVPCEINKIAVGNNISLLVNIIQWLLGQLKDLTTVEIGTNVFMTKLHRNLSGTIIYLSSTPT